MAKPKFRQGQKFWGVIVKKIENIGLQKKNIENLGFSFGGKFEISEFSFKDII